MSEEEILIGRLAKLLVSGRIRLIKTKDGYCVEIVHDTQLESTNTFIAMTDIIERA